MRTEKVEVYLFEELSEEAKEKVRSWGRDGEDDFLVSDISELFTAELEHHYELESDLKVCWSLSYSQGDGVALDGVIANDDIRKICKDKVTNFNRLELAGIIDDLHIKVESSHRGTRSNVVDYTPDYSTYDIREYPRLLKVYDEVIEEVTNKLKEIERELEKTGYAEIEHRESDESIDESLTINEYEFTEDGTFHS